MCFTHWSYLTARVSEISILKNSKISILKNVIKYSFKLVVVPNFYLSVRTKQDTHIKMLCLVVAFVLTSLMRHSQYITWTSLFASYSLSLSPFFWFLDEAFYYLRLLAISITCHFKHLLFIHKTMYADIRQKFKLLKNLVII